MFCIYCVKTFIPISAPPSPLTTFSSILQITLFYATVLGDVNELNQIKFTSLKHTCSNSKPIQQFNILQMVIKYVCSVMETLHLKENTITIVSQRLYIPYISL